MNLQLTTDQARAQLAGLQKQKSVVDRSITMLAESGVELHNAANGANGADLEVIAGALANLFAVQVLQLGIQQEGLAANIAAIEKALAGGGIVLPTFLGPERKA